MENNRTANSVKNVSSGMALKLLLLLLQFASKTVFVKNLDVYLGINSLISSVLSYLNITELGIGTAINFAMYKPIATGDHEKVRQYIQYYKKIYHILGFITLGIAAVMALILPGLFDISEVPFGYDQIYFIYLFYVINACFGYFVFPARGGFLSASQKEYRLTVINIASSISSVILQVTAILIFRQSFVSFVLYTAIPIVIAVIQRLVSGFCIEKWYPEIKDPPAGKLSNPEIKDLYKNTLGLAIEKFCIIINNSVDGIIISALISVTVLGKYSLYFSIISLVSGFTSMLFSPLVPSIGNLSSAADIPYQKRIFNELNFTGKWIYGFCAISYCAIIQPFMIVWAGSDKLLGLFVPIIVALNYLTGGMAPAVTLFRNACGLYYKGRYRPILYTVVNVAFSIVIGYFFNKHFGEVWGVFGIVLATIISRAATTWWFDAYIVFKYVFHESCKHFLLQYLKDLGVILIIGSVVFVGCYQLSGLNVWLHIIISAVICLIAVNSAFILLYHKKEEYQSVKSRIVGLLSNLIKRAISPSDPRH